jgi:dephospho-CoA kinase
MPLGSTTTSSTFIKIAVTGSAGSGKSSVCRRLRELGLTVIDTDGLAREAVAPGGKAFKNIVQTFGDRVVLPEGGLNRPLLRKIIIDDRDARKRLEKLVHPEVIRLMQCRMTEAERAGEPAAVVEVPLLFESNLAGFFDVTVTVSADQHRLVRRLVDRDDVSEKDAAALLNAQMPDGEKCEKAHIVLKNNGSKRQLEQSVERFYQKILQKSAKKKESA